MKVFISWIDYDNVWSWDIQIFPIIESNGIIYIEYHHFCKILMIDLNVAVSYSCSLCF